MRDPIVERSYAYLIFLFIGLLMIAGFLVSKRVEARRAKRLPETDDSQGQTLSARLTESAILFRTAAETLSDDRSELAATITELADRCGALAARDGFSRAARSTIIRLLLSLHDVIQRITKLGEQGGSSPGESLTDKANELIAEASDTLGAIGNRADDTAFRRLETDLDLLKERLDALR